MNVVCVVDLPCILHMAPAHLILPGWYHHPDEDWHHQCHQHCARATSCQLEKNSLWLRSHLAPRALQRSVLFRNHDVLSPECSMQASGATTQYTGRVQKDSGKVSSWITVMATELVTSSAFSPCSISHNRSHSTALPNLAPRPDAPPLHKATTHEAMCNTFTRSHHFTRFSLLHKGFRSATRYTGPCRVKDMPRHAPYHSHTNDVWRDPSPSAMHHMHTE